MPETPKNTDTAKPEAKPEVSKPKMSLLEEDDEFEEFPVEDWDDGKQERDLHQWDDNWEDDDQGEDDFSVQLRRELEKQGKK